MIYPADVLRTTSKVGNAIGFTTGKSGQFAMGVDFSPGHRLVISGPGAGLAAPEFCAVDQLVIESQIAP